MSEEEEPLEVTTEDRQESQKNVDALADELFSTLETEKDERSVKLYVEGFEKIVHFINPYCSASPFGDESTVAFAQIDMWIDSSLQKLPHYVVIIQDFSHAQNNNNNPVWDIRCVKHHTGFFKNYFECIARLLCSDMYIMQKMIDNEILDEFYKLDTEFTENDVTIKIFTLK